MVDDEKETKRRRRRIATATPSIENKGDPATATTTSGRDLHRGCDFAFTGSNRKIRRRGGRERGRGGRTRSSLASPAVVSITVCDRKTFVFKQGVESCILIDPQKSSTFACICRD